MTEVYYKERHLLQGVRECYYKVLQSVTEVYYKVRHLLQGVRDCYYKVCQVLQSEM